MKKFSLFTKKFSFFLMMFFCIIMIFSVTPGCDDGDSTDARLFEAEEALNDGDWEKAITILSDLAPSAKVLLFRSNAYAGSVGINTFDLLTTIDELDDENGEDNSGSIDMIGKLLGAENDILSCELISTKLDTINEAIANINQIPQLTGVELDDDQKVQLGLASITRTAIIIAKLICLNYQDAQGNPADEIILTEAWIKENRNNFPSISSESWESSQTLDAEGNVIHYSTMISEDITNVGNAVAAMSGDNDIKDDFDAFKLEIDNGHGDDSTASDNVITLDELNNYLENMDAK